LNAWLLLYEGFLSRHPVEGSSRGSRSSSGLLAWIMSSFEKQQQIPFGKDSQKGKCGGGLSYSAVT
jgi:hypothetical protein